jgi:hypothetical protein
MTAGLLTPLAPLSMAATGRCVLTPVSADAYSMGLIIRGDP